MRTSNKIKILFVEDLPTDYDLAKREIRKGNIEFESTLVDSKAKFLEALEIFKPDIIVSDYSMPEFDGLQAIKLAAEYDPSLPVVILTGSINEYTAVECIKSGAVDYVIKENMTRLPFAVEDALKLKQLKQDRFETQKALKQSEERYRSLYESMMDAYAVFSMNGKITQWNKAFELMIGYSEKEIIKLSSDDITPECWHELEKNIVEQQVIPKGYSEVYEKEFINKIKGVFPVELRTFLIKDSNGNPSGLWSIVRNITERKHFEDQLKIFQMATEQSPASIAIINLDGKIEYVNAVYSKMTGYTLTEAIGKSFKVLGLGLKKDLEYKELLAILLQGSEWKGEYLNTRKNGELYWESTFISAIKNKAGTIAHLLAVQQDITERKAYELNLMQAKEKAEEINRLKSNFLANMSHELRTPLTGMLSFSELLSEELEGRQKEYVTMINKSSQRLLRTLNTLLNYSVIESEKLECNKNQFSILGLIKEEIQLFEASAKQNKLYLNFEANCPDFQMVSDEKLCKEILDNLLQNAIRFTHSGGISVKLDKAEDTIVIKVIDTGIGIPKDKLDIIWEEFRQVSEGKGRNFDGTGLGLTIVKKYVEVLEGAINIESELGKGSTFTVKIPLSKEIEINPIAEKNEITNQIVIQENKAVNKFKILLVEDDSLNSFAIERMLIKNYEIKTVDNAADAIKACLTAKYDAILMDINLKSGKSGVEATKEIRTNKNYKNTPIIAMTAYALSEDKKEFIESGCSHYISKPFTKDSILHLLSTIFDTTE